MALTATSARTVNSSSFASAFMDATALALDAETMEGHARLRALRGAYRRLYTAGEYAESAFEKSLVDNLQRSLDVMDVEVAA